MRRRQLLTTGAALFALGPIEKSLAQDAWPSRAITLVVPSSAGGSTDFTARVLAQKLGADLRHPVVVDNRNGANGSVGLTQIARARPDGYTIGISTNTYLTFNPSIYASLQYDSIKDFTPIALVSYVPNVLVVNATIASKDIKSLIADLKSQQKPLSYASGGYGSSYHLAAELFKRQAGVEMLHVPYKGGAPAMVDLLSGQVLLAFPPISEALPFLKDGRIRALGVTTRERSPLLPDVPAIGELLPGYEMVLWNGIIGPAGLPGEITKKLGAATEIALRSNEVKPKLMEQGSTVPELPGTPEKFAGFLKSEMAHAQQLVASAGLHKGDASER